MKKLTEAERLYWNNYINNLPTEKRPINPFVEASYAGSLEITDDLLKLYLSGKKTAGSSIVEDFLSEGDELPKVGNYWIYLNSKAEPSCILKTEKIITHKFFDVPIEIAIAEGEGDLSIEYWRKVHEEIYSPHLKRWGLKSISDATVITEYFQIVYK